MIDATQTREWLFRGLMFESEAERFRAAGIRVGADVEESERNLLDETLAPFGVDLRGEALRMARLYALLYCFENSVRALVTQRLRERHGDDWWSVKVPRKVQDFAAARLRDALDNSWLEGNTKDPLSFVQFGHLSDIIVGNWEDFSDLIPSQHWLRQRMDELERARNYIAHNRFLLPGEFARIEMYVRDWNSMVGL